MPKKRILLVGNGNHQFITNYSLWLNKKGRNKFDIDILSYPEVNKKNKKYYRDIFRIQDKTSIYRFVNKLKGLRRYYRFYLYKRIAKRLTSYDYIHFHFINVDSYYLVNQFKKLSKSKIILSIWGSDLYKLKSINEKDFIQCCSSADYLTFTNHKSLDYFVYKYNWQNDNLKLCRFGLAPLESLKKLGLSKTECKEKLGWDTGKLAVTMGYNLSTNQQHLEILRQFKKDELKVLKDEILLVLPLTYGGTLMYKQEIINQLSSLPFEYKIYDVFLEDETVAWIRKASDVMIQLQKSDQFSGSMQEHLYTRNIVVTGSWLPYETMKEEGAWFIEVDEISNLVDVIPDVVKNFTEYEEKTDSNPETILKIGSWERNIEEWIKLYLL